MEKNNLMIEYRYVCTNYMYTIYKKKLYKFSYFEYRDGIERWGQIFQY